MPRENFLYYWCKVVILKIVDVVEVIAVVVLEESVLVILYDNSVRINNNISISRSSKRSCSIDKAISSVVTVLVIVI